AGQPVRRARRARGTRNRPRGAHRVHGGSLRRPGRRRRGRGRAWLLPRHPGDGPPRSRRGHQGHPRPAADRRQRLRPGRRGRRRPFPGRGGRRPGRRRRPHPARLRGRPLRPRGGEPGRPSRRRDGLRGRVLCQEWDLQAGKRRGRDRRERREGARHGACDEGRRRERVRGSGRWPRRRGPGRRQRLRGRAGSRDEPDPRGPPPGGRQAGRHGVPATAGGLPAPVGGEHDPGRRGDQRPPEQTAGGKGRPDGPRWARPRRSPGPHHRGRGRRLRRVRGRNRGRDGYRGGLGRTRDAAGHRAGRARGGRAGGDPRGPRRRV
ncbi:MAG: endo-type 6-aminohexanoate oligomer hydrolase, partial [uncultured Rubrobacteraceae bacterium]